MNESSLVPPTASSYAAADVNMSERVTLTGASPSSPVSQMRPLYVDASAPIAQVIDCSTWGPVQEVKVSRSAVQEAACEEAGWMAVPGDLSAGAAVHPVRLWLRRIGTTDCNLARDELAPLADLAVVPSLAPADARSALIQRWGFEELTALPLGAELFGRRFDQSYGDAAVVCVQDVVITVTRVLPHPAVSPADALAALRAPGDGGLVARSSSSTSMAALQQQQQQQQEATPRFHLHTPATPRSPRLLLNVKAREMLRASAVTVPAVAQLLPDSLDVISQHAPPSIPERDDSNHWGGPHSMGWIDRADADAASLNASATMSTWYAAGAWVIPAAAAGESHRYFEPALNVEGGALFSHNSFARESAVFTPKGALRSSRRLPPIITEAVSVCIWFRTGTWGTSTAAAAASASASIGGHGSAAGTRSTTKLLQASPSAGRIRRIPSRPGIVGGSSSHPIVAGSPLSPVSGAWVSGSSPQVFVTPRRSHPTAQRGMLPPISIPRPLSYSIQQASSAAVSESGDDESVGTWRSSDDQIGGGTNHPLAVVAPVPDPPVPVAERIDSNHRSRVSPSASAVLLSMRGAVAAPSSPVRSDAPLQSGLGMFAGVAVKDEVAFDSSDASPSADDSLSASHHHHPSRRLLSRERGSGSAQLSRSASNSYFVLTPSALHAITPRSSARDISLWLEHEKSGHPDRPEVLKADRRRVAR
jgi:hypothetical protein